MVLPETAEEWDAQRCPIVLLHELTHARRKDPLLWLMAQVAVALYWCHPLAWLAAARFRREQERSCDDAVVRAGADRSAYAEDLLSQARSVTHAGAHSAALAMAAPADLEQRVRALLNARANRNGLSRRVCWAAAGASLTGTVYDASGAVVPGVLVVLKNSTTHQEAARTNGAGAYALSGLPAESYILEIHERGFADFRSAIVLPAAAPTNITLGIGSVTEEVVGKASAGGADDRFASSAWPVPRWQGRKLSPLHGRCGQAGSKMAKARRNSARHQIFMELRAPQAHPGQTTENDGLPHKVNRGKAARPPAIGTPHRIRVVYLPGAEAAGVEGTVLLRAVISTRGDLLGLSVMNQSVDGELAGAAMDAVKQWHYQPTLLNREPVEVVTTISVTFRLER